MNNNRKIGNRQFGRRPRKRVPRSVRRSRQKNKQIVVSNSSTRSSSESLVVSTVEGVVSIPRSHVLPNAILVDFVFEDYSTIERTNALQTYMSWRYVINDLRITDPLLGAKVIPGFAFYGAGYNLYRVLNATYNIDFVNLESNAVSVCCFPTPLDPGSNSANSQYYFSQPYATMAEMSPTTGMDRARLKGKFDLGVIFGNVSAYCSDPGFASSFISDPSSTIYFGVAAISNANFTAGKGLASRVRIVLRTLVYDRKLLTT